MRHLELSSTVDNVNGFFYGQVTPHRHLQNERAQAMNRKQTNYLNQPGKAGHNEHGRVVLGVDDQLAGGEGGHVLVRPVGDGGVGEGDGLRLRVALHIGRGKSHSGSLGGHRVGKVAVQIANESTNRGGLHIEDF